MYFILYNFVQPKLNIVQPPNLADIQFYLTDASVTLHQHPDQLLLYTYYRHPK
jgi:hypothetical protein